MVLEHRKCPNCGSGEILEKDGAYVCMNCRTFFDNPNDIKVTTKTITRDETEIEKIKSEERITTQRDKSYDRVMIVIVIAGIIACILYYLMEGKAG